MLRTPRFQPGQPCRSRPTGPAQSRVAERDRRRAHHFSRTVMLLDVRRGLPRIEITGHGKFARRSVSVRRVHRGLAEGTPSALKFNAEPQRIVIHAHCHAKSLANRLHARLAERLPNGRSTLLETGCCGMAGAFGMLESKYEFSLKVAEAAHRKNQEPALRHDRRGVRHQLPASRSGISSSTAHSTWPASSPTRWREIF
jgi:hypothetical protein